MSTPATTATKAVRISEETHKRLTAVQEHLGGATADQAVRFLLSLEAVRVPVTARQRERWEEAAATAGLPVHDFVRQITEAAVTYGTDRGTFLLLWQHVREMRGMIREIHGLARRQDTDTPL